MKLRKIIALVILCSFSIFAFTACLNKESQDEIAIQNALGKPQIRAIKTLYFSIESQHTFTIQTANVFFGGYTPEEALNGSLSPSQNNWLLMTSDDITDKSYKRVHNLTSDVNYKTSLNTDLGKAKIQFDFYIRYSNGLPMLLSQTCQCYVKSHGFSIYFYKDPKGEIPYTVEFDIDTNYNTGEHLTDGIIVSFHMTS